MNDHNRIPEWLAALAAAAIIIAILFTKPFVGVADNGDFPRLMGMAGIYHQADEPRADKYFSYAHSVFAYGSWFGGGYVSSQALLVAAASLVGKLWDGQWFHIRVLGAMYGLLLGLAYYLLVRFGKSGRPLADLAAAAALVFIFTDIGYIAYFNSFFGEPYSLVTLLLTVAFAIGVIRQEHRGRGLLTAFFAAALLLATSKIQNAPIGVLLGLLAFRFMTLRNETRWRRTAAFFGAALIVCSAVMYAAAPQELKHINLYQTVFYGILKDSPDPAADLRELGLPESLAVNAGTNYFEAGTTIPQDDPRLESDFYARVSHADVALFYLRHPGRFVQKLERAAENGMTIRPYYLGNFEKAEGKAPGAMAFAFSGWSEFKRGVLPNRLWLVGSFFAAYYLALAAAYLRRPDKRDRILLELGAAIGLIGAFAFIVPLIGDGEADLGKHLFLFNVVFDLMVLISFACALRLFRRRKGSRYGYRYG